MCDPDINMSQLHYNSIPYAPTNTCTITPGGLTLPSSDCVVMQLASFNVSQAQEPTMGIMVISSYSVGTIPQLSAVMPSTLQPGGEWHQFRTTVV
jgi:sulfite exporter TauE/SafE